MLIKEKLKHIKKIYSKKNLVKINNFKFNKNKKNKIKTLLRIKKFIKYKVYKPFFNKSLTLNKIKKFTICLTVKVTSNNIFCTLRNVIKNNILMTASSGKYNIKVSRKKLRHTFKPVLTSFFQEIKTKILVKDLFVVLIAPIKLRKQILKFIYPKILHNKNLIIKVKEKKCFNGCRVKKKKRKKQKGLKLWK